MVIRSPIELTFDRCRVSSRLKADLKKEVRSILMFLALGIFGFVVSCLPIPEPPSLPSDTLPTELTDNEFWRMGTDFSEPDGPFPYENCVSNEIAFQSILPELTRRV